MNIIKKFLNQNDIAEKIHCKTSYATEDIQNILNSFKDVLLEELSQEENVMLKPFSGFQINAKYVSTDQSVAKHLGIKSNSSLFLSAKFTDNFRKKIRKFHNWKYRYVLTWLLCLVGT